ncbi:hypothetical protein ACFY9R_21075 [Streptomyces albidoflavus]|uniref:hypothetical protein n=1 Tax=Streptomyces albidoflavus TaxID=1886 RepID=UPI003328038D
MTGIRLYWPLWLIRLYRRLGAGRFAWTAALVAVLAGVPASGALDPLSGVLGGWLRLFGFALGLCLIWFVAVGTAPKPWLPASYVIALCMLVLWAVLIDQDRALAQRGEWTSATVISREDTPKSSSCTLRFQDGTEGPGPLGGCRNAEAGDRIRVFHDPEQSMRPSNTRPNLPLWTGLSAASTLIMAATTYVAANRGQQRYVPPARPPARTAPPPPPPPPPGRSPGLR